MSPGDKVSLIFQTDGNNPERHQKVGFSIQHQAIDIDECSAPEPGDGSDPLCSQICLNTLGTYFCSCHHGFELHSDQRTCVLSCTEDLSGLNSGNISSPSWPASYAENANCQHTLSVEAHLWLELHFSEDFDVEQSPDGQCIDALTIETPSGTLGPFCGHTPPPSPFLTHSNHVQIRFISDGFGTNKGFSLYFKTRDKVCPAVVTPHSTVTPQQPEYSQGETVTVTCDLGYVVNSTLSSEYLTTCQSTGVWTPTYMCEPVDCGFPGIPEDGILQLVGSAHTQYKDQIQFNCSSKYYTLEGDETYICNATGEWASDGGKTELPKCTEMCGKPEKHPASIGRILGGKNAKLGEIPWHLLIKEPRRGGASLINDRWAVTGAVIVEDIEETSLRLYGGLIDGRTADSLSDVVVVDSERIIIHPDYVKGIDDRTSFDNDIALIRFSSRVNLGPNLIPICLPEVKRSWVENELGTVSGWGKTEVQIKKEDATRFVTSAQLKYAHIGVKPLSECEDTPLTSTKERMLFTNNMFCAGADGKDSCQKDSGGPFVLPMLAEGREPYYLTGIVSWGPPCEERQYKGYYTKVENYVDWIKKTIDTIEKS
ncbi:complement C1s subcomponent-like isoform X1 [Micropterus dolomieu]|uniref:complement C1s subcomponent-like isoform X1 n=1 Tax=Micropterus dolomieu TaxID=147949 RepID=UPI001E8DCCBD|nr:complement C1s subcomponent-like isoform X1 [Micropterus dolomieu]